MPDSLEHLIVEYGGHRVSICQFERTSKLELLESGGKMRGFGFMRISEPSLKKIRSVHEWIGS
jgi:hypothetical protein